MDKTGRRTRRSIWLALGLAAALGFAACGGGGGGGNDDVATLGGDQASDEGGGGELTEDEIRDAQLDFAECMRDHGIDMPDPQIGDDGETVIQIGPGEGGAAPDEEEMEAAQEACQHFLEKLRDNAPEMDPEEQEQAKQQALDFAQCMREQGVEDFPDPEFQDGGRIGTKIEEGVGNDPDFEAAQEHCADEFGEGGPRRSGPGGGGSSRGSESAD